MDIYRYPWKLIQNKIVRYPGGREIDRFRGVTPPKDDGRPEAWVGSTVRTVAAGHGADINDGCAQCVLPDGTIHWLFEALQKWPEELLGAEHRRRNGDDLAVLVKLLDAEKQLGLQTHPTRAYAKEHFDSNYGKEESWYILGVRDDSPETPYVLLGFRENVTRTDFERGYDAEDITAMEQCCHKIPVKAGDAFFIKAGCPHAVGCGCFMVEVQEPSDITVGARKLQGADAKTEAEHKQRLLGCYNYDGADAAKNLRQYKIPPKTLREGDWGREQLIIGPEQTSYFSFSRLDVTAETPLLRTGFFQIMIVVSGAGVLTCGEERYALKQGDELFLPYNMHKTALRPDGALSVMLCNPPGVVPGG